MAEVQQLRFAFSDRGNSQRMGTLKILQIAVYHLQEQRKGREGKERKGKGKEGKGRDGMEWEGKGRDGMEWEGKGRDGMGREGNARSTHMELLSREARVHKAMIGRNDFGALPFTWTERNSLLGSMGSHVIVYLKRGATKHAGKTWYGLEENTVCGRAWKPVKHM